MNKSNQTAGSKIFDLKKKYPEYKTGFLQQNLKEFTKKFGSKFRIKYKNIYIHVSLEKVKLLNGIEFYRMIYDIPHRTTHLTPFIIDFVDSINSELNNNSYISNIHKTDKISGSEMIKICLSINRILGVIKTYLYDGTQVKCDKNNEKMDLSLLKLIERKLTFYTNLGFDFEVTNKDWLYLKYSNKYELKDKVNILIKNIRAIRTKDVIKEYNKTLELLVKIIINNYNGKFEILTDNSNPSRLDEIYSENPKEKILEIFTEAKEVLAILNKYKKEDKLYKILIKTFKKSCNEYTILNKYIIENLRTKIIYNKEIIERTYVEDFNYLMMYRFNSCFSYTFI